MVFCGCSSWKVRILAWAPGGDMGGFGAHGGESPVTRALGLFGLGGDASPRPAVLSLDTRASPALPPGPRINHIPCPGLGARVATAAGH